MFSTTPAMLGYVIFHDPLKKSMRPQVDAFSLGARVATALLFAMLRVQAGKCKAMAQKPIIGHSFVEGSFRGASPVRPLKHKSGLSYLKCPSSYFSSVWNSEEWLDHGWWRARMGKWSDTRYHFRHLKYQSLKLQLSKEVLIWT